jgi:DNA processing protein
MNEEFLYTLALKFTSGIGDITIKKLIERYGSAKMVWQTNKKEIANEIGGAKVLASDLGDEKLLSLAKKEWDFLVKNNHQFLTYQDDEYPVLLKEAPDSPVVIFYDGDINFSAKTTFISVVGTRNATNYGHLFLQEFMEGLEGQPITFVSGLAYGIDKIVHDQALKYNFQTIGVVAHGLNMLYPSNHKKIASQMLNKGGILTEYPSFEEMHASKFLSRNRIIAGLSKATIIVESDYKGGSLSTANFANDYNRDVLALPGRITDKYSSGCNKLIKDNKAQIITGAEDMLNYLELINKKPLPKATKLFFDLPEPQKSILELIQKENKIHIEKIALEMATPTYKLMPILLDLELKDLILPLSGSYYQVN